MKGSGNSFVRAITKILRPIREFTDAFVDDVAVHSDQWRGHMNDLDNFLSTVKEAGFTLNLYTVNLMAWYIDRLIRY